MPVYEFLCDTHGNFERFSTMQNCKWSEPCPSCGQMANRVVSMAIKVVRKERLQFGEGSPGKMILGKETGGLDIFIPSMGAMEQDEVDYIAAGAIEKERERVKTIKKHGARNENQARLQAYTNLALSTPKGKRAKVLRAAMEETGDKLVTNRG